jgi:uncharacterized membrane protein
LRRIGKHDWRYLLFLMLSHHPPERLHRTICLGFRGKNVYLCARCTGTYSSLIAVLVAYFIGLRFPLWLYLPLISVLPISATIDWLTQSGKLRESRNSIRVGTGLLLGIAEAHLLLLVINGMVSMFLVAMSIIGLYAISIYMVALKTKCLDSYLDDIMRGY